MTTMQNVAREQKREMKKIEKMERKMDKQKSDAEREKSKQKRQMLRQAQLENLRTLQGLREELKPQDFRKSMGNNGPTRRATTDGGGMFKNLASNLVAVKKVQKRSSYTMGECGRNLSDHDKSVWGSVDGEGEKDDDEPQIFAATLAAMKLAASTNHYQANGQNRFNATLAALKLNDMSRDNDWDNNVDEGDGLDESLEEYDSRPLPLNMRGTSGLELINVEALKPTSRGREADDCRSSGSNGYNLQTLVPKPRSSAGRALALNETNIKMNYYDDENSMDGSYGEECGEEHLEALNDTNPSELEFHPTPLPLNPLREDSEASYDCMLPPSSEAYHSGGDKQNFQRGNYLLKNQGKTPSGHTNRTKSTNTMQSSNDSVGASDVSSPPRRKTKMSRLKNSFRNSFNRRGSGGSVTSAVSELTPGSRAHGSSQSVGTSSSWRRRLSGFTGGGSGNFKSSNESPPEYVEAKGKSGDRRQVLKSGPYVSTSMVSDLTTHSSGRSLNRAASRKSSLGTDEGSVSSRFGEFFDDSSHAQALTDALSTPSNESYYRFPTHEHPLIRIKPVELFPDSPGWQCDSCSMETTNMNTMAYVSTDRNFIVCRQCFASLGSKIETS